MKIKICKFVAGIVFGGFILVGTNHVPNVQDYSVRNPDYSTRGHLKYLGDEIQVYGKDGSYQGKSTKNGTFDKNGSRISPDQVPTLLLPNK